MICRGRLCYPSTLSFRLREERVAEERRGEAPCLVGAASRGPGCARACLMSCCRKIVSTFLGGTAVDQTESFRVRPALKRTDLDALILMASPVRGFTPLRAARFATTKVPKPAN